MQFIEVLIWEFHDLLKQHAAYLDALVMMTLLLTQKINHFKYFKKTGVL